MNAQGWPRAKVSQSFLARFWTGVEIGSDSGCWPWRRSFCGKGYGVFYYGKRRFLAHRLSWELATAQEVPPEQFVCHRCDNPPCVNPAHLFLGTVLENMRDAATKGRLARGPNNAMARLSEDDVRNILVRLEQGEYQDSIGADFGVTGSTIGRIARRECWGHIAGALKSAGGGR